MASRRRVSPVQPRDRLQAAARDAHRPVHDLQGIHARCGRPAQRRATLRGLFRFKPAGPPVPIDEVEPVESDRQAIRDGRDVVRLDQPGSPRDAGHRDEPPRRQVQHGRGRRNPERFCRWRTATRSAARSSRSRRDASASPASTWSTPTSCRSRWRRAPSPARAVSFPGTRSIRGLRKCGTRRPASV